MREVKFRGKRIDNGEWVYGYYYAMAGRHYINAIVRDEGGWISNVYEVAKDTVGRFTGLHDKNGVDIYEGDIVNQNFFKETGGYYNEGETFEGFNIGEVVIIASKGVCLKNPLLHLEVNGEIETELSKTKMYKGVVRSRCEVVGNIYENPELVNPLPTAGQENK